MDYINNENNDLGDGQMYKYKQFSDDSLAIYKFVLSLLDKYGVLAVDWMGYILGLNKNSTPISKQTPAELSSNLTELAEKLKDPEITKELIQIIKESEPILKQVLYSFLSVLFSSGEFLIKDALTFICSDTPVAPICGLFKFAENTVDFGQDLLDSERSTLNSAEGTLKMANQFQDTLNSASDKSNEFQEKANNFTNKIREKANNYTNKFREKANNLIPKLQNIYNNPNLSNEIQEKANNYTNKIREKANNYTNKFREKANNLIPKLQNIYNNPNISNEIQEKANNYTNKIRKKANNYTNKIREKANNLIPKVPNISNDQNIPKVSNLKSQTDPYFMKGGKQLKNMAKEKKNIITRVNKSIYDFLYLKPKHKTKRIKRN